MIDAEEIKEMTERITELEKLLAEKTNKKEAVCAV